MVLRSSHQLQNRTAQKLLRLQRQQVPILLIHPHYAKAEILSSRGVEAGCPCLHQAIRDAYIHGGWLDLSANQSELCLFLRLT
jgi:hypothetical protein